MKIAKLDDLHGRCQQLLLCRVGDGIQVIGRAAALAEPRLAQAGRSRGRRMRPTESAGRRRIRQLPI